MFVLCYSDFSEKTCEGYPTDLDTNLLSPPAHGGHIGTAGMSVPGAIGISGQAALSAGLTVQLTLVQGQLGHTLPGAHKQPLLKEEERRGWMKDRNRDGGEQ